MPRRRGVGARRRRGQRRRNRVHYHKVVNYVSSFYQYQPSGGSWARATYGPQIAGGLDLGSGVYAGTAYFLDFSFIDVYNNASADQQIEIEALNDLFSQRQFAGVRVSLIPRVNRVFEGPQQDPSKVDSSGRRSVNESFYSIPYHSAIGNFLAPPSDGNWVRAHSDMRGAKSHRLYQGGSHYMRPRVTVGSPYSSVVGNTCTPVVLDRTARAPWVSTGHDAQATLLTQVRYTGLLLLFPAPSVLMQYDLKLTYYIKYRSHY